MTKIKYALKGGLNKKQLEQIRREALQVLEEVGMELSHKQTLKLLAGHKGITIKGNRIYFKSWLSGEYLEKVKGTFKKSSQSEKFKILGPYYCGKIIDVDSHKIRATTSKDLVDAFKLCDAMDAVRGIAPVVPNDVPLKLQTLASWKIALEISPHGRGAPPTNIEEAEYTKRMIEAVGRKDYGWNLECTVSPLKFNNTTLEIVHYYLNKGNLIKGSSGIILLVGATAPIFAPGFLIQGMAETLGGYIVLQIISASKAGNGVGEFSAFPVDMQSGNISFGSPEFILFDLVRRQVSEYFWGHSTRYGRLLTSSKDIDAQAITEHSASIFINALAGIRNFVSAGMLYGDNIYSPELLVIDREITNYAERIIKGFKFEKETLLSLKTIREVLQQGHNETYLTHHTTLEQYRDIYWMPNLFNRESIEKWQEEGMSIRNCAATIAKEKIAGYHFELKRDVQKELDKIYEEASLNFLL